jgi:hypothetical protein
MHSSAVHKMFIKKPYPYRFETLISAIANQRLFSSLTCIADRRRMEEVILHRSLKCYLQYGMASARSLHSQESVSVTWPVLFCLFSTVRLI